MAWEDRPYYRDAYNPDDRSWLWRMLTGSVPLYTAFGIRVRMHASLVMLIVFELLYEWSRGNLLNGAIGITALFVIILLHEYGHCFAARAVGGEANDILMWPLGGLAYAMPPRRWLATFITVAAGPLVNVIICLATAGLIYFISSQWVTLDPFHPLPPGAIHAASNVSLYLWWIFTTSYWLFLFNVLPIYPMDGGQMLQALIWPMKGYYKSMVIACRVGIVGAGFLCLSGLYRGIDSLLIMIGASCFLYCWQQLHMLKEMRPEDWAMEYDGPDYSVSLQVRRETETPRRKRRANPWRIRRMRKLAMLEATEQQQIDSILAKVSAQGMSSLTWREKRVLKSATERQRRRETESTG